MRSRSPIEGSATNATSEATSQKPRRSAKPKVTLDFPGSLAAPVRRRETDVEQQPHAVGAQGRDPGAGEAESRKPERAEDQHQAQYRLDRHDRERDEHGGTCHLVGPEAALEHERRRVEQHRAGGETEVRHRDLDDLRGRGEPSEDRPRRQEREEETEHGDALRNEHRGGKRAAPSRRIVRPDGSRDEGDARDADRLDESLHEVDALGGVSPRCDGRSAEATDERHVDDVDEVHDDERKHRGPGHRPDVPVDLARACRN